MAGLFHDLGKFSSAFQKRIRGNGPITDHATAGAQEIMHLMQQANQSLIGTLLAYCIAGHHTGLPDYGSAIDLPSDPTLRGRLKRAVEPYEAYLAEIATTTLPNAELPKLRQTTRSGGFSVSFLVRMLYSMLVDADFIETETFIAGKKPRGGNPEVLALEQSLSDFFQNQSFEPSPVNLLRADILKACQERAVEPQGVFCLTVPTGGGKTLSSLSFALSHALKHNLERVIYVIPYTTIIEQNASVFKQIFGDDLVLEHHSNFDWEAFRQQNSAEDADSSVSEKLKLATENWDIPIIVTTNVQFFESLFASRSSRCRKNHNIANSVIVFDEAQMIPREFLKPCMLSIAELVLNYRCSAVLCTATQPELHRFFPETLPVVEITRDPIQLYEAFKRINLHDLGALTDEDLVAKLAEHDQVLCIVNTRKHAGKLHKLMPAFGRYHLSTLMYPQHRKRVIQSIRDALKLGLPCRVISTQLIEAGVDLDFPVGYRALAGLDSIIQAGGRVNRNRKRADADLYIFEPITDSIKKLPGYIAQTGDVTRQILRRWAGRDPICVEAIQEYYQILYGLQDEKHAFDTHDILSCFEKPGTRDAAFDFRTAAERFSLIGSDTVSIIIPFEDEIKRLVVSLRKSALPVNLLRKLQVYSVNVYKNEFDLLCKSGKVEVINDLYPVLLDPLDNYSEEIGLIIPTTGGGDAIFFDS